MGLVRGQWGFQGYITSDCGAIDDIFTPHNYSATREDTCAAAIKAGTDLDCGGVSACVRGEAGL